MSRFSDLKKRFLFSTAIIIVVLGLLFFAYNIVASLAILALVCALSYFCMKEYLALAKAKEIELPENFQLIGAVLLPLTFYVGAQLPVFSYFPWWVFFFLVFGSFLLSFKEIENSFQRVAMAVLSFVYIALPLGLLMTVLYQSSSGRFWVLFVIAVAKITDMAAYFGGRIFGKKLLASKLSPKKTWAGAIWGVIFGAITGALLSLIDGYHFYEMIRLAILAILISAVGQLGDLAESLIKRDAKKKDSSALPGIGGMLDMADSLLFTIPIIFLYLG